MSQNIFSDTELIDPDDTCIEEDKLSVNLRQNVSTIKYSSNMDPNDSIMVADTEPLNLDSNNHSDIICDDENISAEKTFISPPRKKIILESAKPKNFEKRLTQTTPDKSQRDSEGDTNSHIPVFESQNLTNSESKLLKVVTPLKDLVKSMPFVTDELNGENKENLPKTENSNKSPNKSKKSQKTDKGRKSLVRLSTNFKTSRNLIKKYSCMYQNNPENVQQKLQDPVIITSPTVKQNLDSNMATDVGFDQVLERIYNDNIDCGNKENIDNNNRNIDDINKRSSFRFSYYRRKLRSHSYKHLMSVPVESNKNKTNINISNFNAETKCSKKNRKLSKKSQSNSNHKNIKVNAKKNDGGNSMVNLNPTNQTSKIAPSSDNNSNLTSNFSNDNTINDKSQNIANTKQFQHKTPPTIVLQQCESKEVLASDNPRKYLFSSSESVRSKSLSVFGNDYRDEKSTDLENTLLRNKNTENITKPKEDMPTRKRKLIITSSTNSNSNYNSNNLNNFNNLNDNVTTPMLKRLARHQITLLYSQPTYFTITQEWAGHVKIGEVKSQKVEQEPILIGTFNGGIINKNDNFKDVINKTPGDGVFLFGPAFSNSSKLKNEKPIQGLNVSSNLTPPYSAIYLMSSTNNSSSTGKVADISSSYHTSEESANTILEKRIIMDIIEKAKNSQMLHKTNYNTSTNSDSCTKDALDIPNPINAKNNCNNRAENIQNTRENILDNQNLNLTYNNNQANTSTSIKIKKDTNMVLVTDTEPEIIAESVTEITDGGEKCLKFVGNTKEKLTKFNENETKNCGQNSDLALLNYLKSFTQAYKNNTTSCCLETKLALILMGWPCVLGLPVPKTFWVKYRSDANYYPCKLILPNVNLLLNCFDNFIENGNQNSLLPFSTTMLTKSRKSQDKYNTKKDETLLLHTIISESSPNLKMGTNDSGLGTSRLGNLTTISSSISTVLSDDKILLSKPLKFESKNLKKTRPQENIMEGKIEPLTYPLLPKTAKFKVQFCDGELYSCNLKDMIVNVKDTLIPGTLILVSKLPINNLNNLSGENNDNFDLKHNSNALFNDLEEAIVNRILFQNDGQFESIEITYVNNKFNTKSKKSPAKRNNMNISATTDKITCLDRIVLCPKLNGGHHQLSAKHKNKTPSPPIYMTNNNNLLTEITEKFEPALKLQLEKFNQKLKLKNKDFNDGINAKHMTVSNTDTDDITNFTINTSEHSESPKKQRLTLKTSMINELNNTPNSKLKNNFNQNQQIYNNSNINNKNDNNINNIGFSNISPNKRINDDATPSKRKLLGKRRLLTPAKTVQGGQLQNLIENKTLNRNNNKNDKTPEKSLTLPKITTSHISSPYKATRKCDNERIFTGYTFLITHKSLSNPENFTNKSSPGRRTSLVSQSVFQTPKKTMKALMLTEEFSSSSLSSLDHDIISTIPFDRFQLETLIKSNGGCILETFPPWADLIAFKSTRTIPENTNSALIKPCDNFQTTTLICISDSYARTEKFLKSLACDIPILSHIFIYECLREGTIITDFSRYLLPAGKCLSTGAIISQSLKSFQSFTNLTVMICIVNSINKNGNKNKVTGKLSIEQKEQVDDKNSPLKQKMAQEILCRDLLTYLGVRILEFTGMDDIASYKPTFLLMLFADSISNTSSKTEVKRFKATIERYCCQNSLTPYTQIVTYEWLIQALITNKFDCKI